jgi:hypothetical protein
LKKRKQEKLKKEQEELKSLKESYIDKYKDFGFKLNKKLEFDPNGESIIDIINSKDSLYDFYDIVQKLKRPVNLLTKYGTDIGNKLIKHEYFLGMSTEQLIDCKGEPTKIEKEELRTKVNEIYIYGNKSSGDVFTFVDNQLQRFKDR